MGKYISRLIRVFQMLLALVVMGASALGVYAIGAITLIGTLIVGAVVAVCGVLGVILAVSFNIIRGPRR